MAQMANIVLDDATSPTPVSHTYKPNSLVNNYGVYIDDSPATLAEWGRLTASIRPADRMNTGHKVTWTLSIPLPRQSESGECCVPHGTPLPEIRIKVEVLREKTATNQQINDALAQLADLVVNSQFLASARGENLR